MMMFVGFDSMDEGGDLWPDCFLEARFVQHNKFTPKNRIVCVSSLCGRITLSF